MFYHMSHTCKVSLIHEYQPCLSSSWFLRKVFLHSSQNFFAEFGWDVAVSTKGFFTASNSMRRSSKLFFMWKDSFSFWCKSVLPATSSTALYHRVEVTTFQVTQSSTLWGSTTTLNKFFMGNSSHTCTLLIWNEKLCTHRIMSQKSIKTNYSVDLNIIDIDEESRFLKKSENPSFDFRKSHSILLYSLYTCTHLYWYYFPQPVLQNSVNGTSQILGIWQ